MKILNSKIRKRKGRTPRLCCGARPDVVPRRTLRLCELEPLDLRRVELAAVGREEDGELSHDRRVERETPVSDLGGLVDLETRAVVEVIVLDPTLGDRRKPLSLREPRELDLEFVVLDGDGLDLTAEEVALVLVLDLHLSTGELCNRLRCQLHYTPPNVLDYHDSLVAGMTNLPRPRHSKLMMFECSTI